MKNSKNIYYSPELWWAAQNLEHKAKWSRNTVARKAWDAARDSFEGPVCKCGKYVMAKRQHGVGEVCPCGWTRKYDIGHDVYIWQWGPFANEDELTKAVLLLDKADPYWDRDSQRKELFSRLSYLIKNGIDDMPYLHEAIHILEELQK